ncbi:MAG: hypothetical protein P1U89_07220 [Verrucomicrobiales bacterium]|nr:hypothetical protein [Verrucomicrobiales bacterium]
MSESEEHYLDTPEAIASYFERLSTEGHEICAVDTEADSLHSYETKMCLIQFAVPGNLAIIDPLAVELHELDPMLDFFKTTKAIWMHGADYDMSMFRKTFNWIPEVVWDTQSAARLLGVRKYGLANLLEEEFGLVVSKQSQKANWGKRPLSEKMLAYAFNDVRYLIELGDRYLKRLEEKGRRGWFEELCAAARVIAEEREERSGDEVWRINGWGKLDPRGLAFLKGLWNWRDEECKRLDRPHFKFMSNNELIEFAKQLQKGERIEPPKYLRPAFARRMLKAISEIREIPESEFPVKYRRNGGPRLEIDEDRFLRMRDYRDKVAEELDIDSTLIATRQNLEFLASPNVDGEEKESMLLNWQKELIREEL